MFGQKDKKLSPADFFFNHNSLDITTVVKLQYFQQHATYKLFILNLNLNVFPRPVFSQN